jgi:beta-galactosidase beta subunit
MMNTKNQSVSAMACKRKYLDIHIPSQNYTTIAYTAGKLIQHTVALTDKQLSHSNWCGEASA